MAEFQEQQAFKGAFQSQGFDPITAPDTSRYLRENMGMIDANLIVLQNNNNKTINTNKRKLKIF